MASSTRSAVRSKPSPVWPAGISASQNADWPHPGILWRWSSLLGATLAEPWWALLSTWVHYRDAPNAAIHMVAASSTYGCRSTTATRPTRPSLPCFVAVPAACTSRRTIGRLLASRSALRRAARRASRRARCQSSQGPSAALQTMAEADSVRSSTHPYYYLLLPRTTTYLLLLTTTYHYLPLLTTTYHYLPLLTTTR